MSSLKKVNSGHLFMGRLGFGQDLLEEITSACIDKNIRLGRIEAIGAVQRARLGYYDQTAREYNFFTVDKPLEITGLTGNVSVKEDKPMVHAHITLADESGNALGGHLAPGTLVFACEILIESFNGDVLNREYDEQTGLPLWNIKLAT